MTDTPLSRTFIEDGLDGSSVEEAERILNEPHMSWTAREQFMVAAMNPDVSVRCHYAESVSKPLLFQAALVDATTPVEVLCALARSSHTHPTILTLLARSSSLSVRVAATLNPRCPVDGSQAALVDSKNSVEVMVAVAKSPCTDPAILSYLGIRMKPTVRVAVAQNPRCPLDTLRSMLLDHPLMDPNERFVAFVARQALYERIEAAKARHGDIDRDNAQS